ncbi:MAG: hypothetical protein ABIO35_10935 [Nitrobacter sp.]
MMRIRDLGLDQEGQRAVFDMPGSGVRRRQLMQAYRALLFAEQRMILVYGHRLMSGFHTGGGFGKPERTPERVMSRFG